MSAKMSRKRARRRASRLCASRLRPAARIRPPSVPKPPLGLPDRPRRAPRSAAALANAAIPRRHVRLKTRLFVVFEGCFFIFLGGAWRCLHTTRRSHATPPRRHLGLAPLEGPGWSHPEKRRFSAVLSSVRPLFGCKDFRWGNHITPSHHAHTHSLLDPRLGAQH